MQLEVVEQRTQPLDPPLPGAELAPLVSALGRPDWWLNLVLADDTQMADLNQRWYGGQGPTDVLSFSYLEVEGDGEPALASGEAGAADRRWLAPGDEVGPVTAGEVVIAPEFVARRCKAEGWDLKAEWALLLVHGALHVLGWTHDTEEEREAMQMQEAAILATVGRTHPLRPAGEDH